MKNINTFIENNFSKNIETKNKGNIFLLVTLIGLLCFYFFENSRIQGFLIGFIGSFIFVLIIYFYYFSNVSKKKEVIVFNPFDTGNFIILDDVTFYKKALLEKLSADQKLDINKKFYQKSKVNSKDLKRDNISYRNMDPDSDLLKKIDSDEKFNEFYFNYFFLDLYKIDKNVSPIISENPILIYKSLIDLNSTTIIKNIDFLGQILESNYKNLSKDQIDIYDEVFSKIQIIKSTWSHEHAINFSSMYALNVYLKIYLKENINKKYLKE